jgi:hypothetical protein
MGMLYYTEPFLPSSQSTSGWIGSSSIHPGANEASRTFEISS